MAAFSRLSSTFVRQALTLLLMLLAARSAEAQEPEAAMFSRTTGMSVNGIDYYNLDGIEISTQQLRSSFHKNTIRGHFTAFPIGSHNLNASDSALDRPNFIVSVDATDKNGYQGNSTTWFIQTSDTSVRAIRMLTPYAPDRDFQHRFISVILDGRIPPEGFTSHYADSFDFVGRMMRKGQNCGWVSLNNLQCRSFGQMNWSLHKSLKDAQDVLEGQYYGVVQANKVKPLSDDTVAVIFEGVPVRAHRVVFSVKGLSGVLTRAAGAKTLTTYYIAAEVRGRYVHCVLSHWNTAVTGTSGLPLLLEQVMRLEPS